MQTEEAKNKFPIFSQRFNNLRGNMSQADFAKFLDISRPTVGFYENGTRLPDALTLKNIAQKCGVPSDWLLGITDSRCPENIEMAKQFQLSDKAISVLKLAAEDANNDANSLSCLLEEDYILYNILSFLLSHPLPGEFSLKYDGEMELVEKESQTQKGEIKRIRMSELVDQALLSEIERALVDLKPRFAQKFFELRKKKFLKEGDKCAKHHTEEK